MWKRMGIAISLGGMRHESLGIWTSTQRTNYRLLKEGKTSPMTDDRIRKLESIGFCWSNSGDVTVAKPISTQQTMLQQIRILVRTCCCGIKDFRI